jgi:beta-glucosidase/6-phospho-beta-glucosidase/beta-galactosidase
VIRVVAFRKAAVAGVAGAAGWEIAARLAQLVGLSPFDLVKTLGTLAFPHGRAEHWWPAGMAVHALVGICWAVFYAYFWWGRLRWRPALQGLAFSLLPALLALFVVLPQVRLMRLDGTTAHFGPEDFVAGLSIALVASVLLGHALFGLIVGAIYTRPVGYRVGDAPKVRKQRAGRVPSRRRRDPGNSGFIFATGIECSYPTVENGRWRRDEMQSTGHYERWQHDFDLTREIGATHLRYGPPLHIIFTAPGRYDWSLIDEPMAELERHGPEPIVDLCHFGVPAWLGNFQNPDIAAALSEYAGAFAHRYPWVRFYTPVNEMYVSSRLSALEGLWNEQRRDERSFVTAAVNLASASVAMTDAILARRPDAVFVNSESSEFYQACCPDEKIQERASFENERRFLPLDLIYAHPLSDRIRAYMSEHGVADAVVRRFAERTVPRRSILGVDYYEWNEKLIDSDGNPRALGELFGWYVIANQYWQRYGRPMMHTETNRLDASDAPRWLWRQWHNVQLLRSAGVPLVGFTWYSLIDQIDWGIALAEPLGGVDPVGLFDLNRDPRPVGLAYRNLIAMHADKQGYRECAALAEVMA